jgi:hypothetical protein
MKNKLDPNKLTLPGKKEIRKNLQSLEIDKAVMQIHEPGEKDMTEVTKRTTLDIPENLHKTIKRRCVDMGISIKDYFLDLARKDLATQSNIL